MEKENWTIPGALVVFKFKNVSLFCVCVRSRVDSLEY